MNKLVLSPRKKLILGLAALLGLGLAIFAARMALCLFMAQRSIEQKDFDSARSWYEKLGDEERLKQLDAFVVEDSYAQACQAMEAEDFILSCQLFSQLDNYKDSDELYLKCCLSLGYEYLSQDKLSAAEQIFRSLGGYPGAGEGLEQIRLALYSQAMALAKDFKLNEAARLFGQLGEYKKSDKLKLRCENILSLQQAEDKITVIHPNRIFPVTSTAKLYKLEMGYIAVNGRPNKDTRFMLYYPGGRDIPVSLDFVASYLMAPPENSICLFLNGNGLEYMHFRNDQAIELLDEIAMEYGIFVDELLLCGSSLGVYPAMRSAIYSYEDYGIEVPCVLCLDAGSDWQESWLLLDEDERERMAEYGTELYLFESKGVGRNRAAIDDMFRDGIDLTMVYCYFDQHDTITSDALGNGMIDWAMGDRAQPFDSDLYTFQKFD